MMSQHPGTETASVIQAVLHGSAVSGLGSDGQGREASVSSRSQRKASIDAQPRLTLAESCMAPVMFAAWLALFGAGIMVDTTPYRCRISPTGVEALSARGAFRTDAAGEPDRKSDVCPAVDPKEQPSAIHAWSVVLVSFLPLNLAWVCATAGALGALGGIADLSNDHPHRSAKENRNPYVSAVLRGFFVYLFLTSGLLLLDDAPFASPTPAQYIRLAGFLSLFSFVVSYQPRLFNKLIVWAFERIQLREGEGGGTADAVYTRKTTLELKASSTPHETVDHGAAR